MHDELNDDFFMQRALMEAQRAYDEGEVPIGCVIVKNRKIIARGYNRMETLKDPTAHAEILTIGSACTSLENWRLEECTLYVTLEPCPMCAGAILNSRLARVVFGAPDKRLGACGTTMNILNPNPINREVAVHGGVMQNECLGIIQNFFKDLRSKKRTKNNEDASLLNNDHDNGDYPIHSDEGLNL